MNGFIELTIKNNSKKVLININNVRDITDDGCVCFENEYYYSVEESYEEIRELIKNAQ